MSNRVTEDDIRPLDPSGDPLDNFYDYEENYKPEHDITILEWIIFISRCVILFIFLLSYILVFVSVIRGTRIKNWRLYSVVAFCLMCWLTLALYQDHIDEYFVHAVYRSPQSRSIYWCIRNLFHGMTLFAIVLLLSHLADFQHRGVWLALVASVVVIPLIYSVALLIIDLRLHPTDRGSWSWNVGISTARVFMYNVLTTLLLFIFSPRFCTSRLYGAFEEARSSLVVVLSRWTFTFLLLHNMVAIAAYGVYITAKIPDASGDVLTLSSVQRILDEVAFLMVVLAIPFSYVASVFCQCGCCDLCCKGSSPEAPSDVEMDKMDKIYQEVWNSNQDRRKKFSGRNGSVTSNPEPSTVTMDTNVSSGRVNSRPNAREVTTADKRRKRESYFEAVSMGSLNDETDRPSSKLSSVTSEPIDL